MKPKLPHSQCKEILERNKRAFEKMDAWKIQNPLSWMAIFADIVTYRPEMYKGILALQVRNHPEVLPPLMARLSAYLKAQPAVEHHRGKLFVVEVDRIRIRE